MAIEISGFEDVEDILQDMSLSDSDKRKIMREAIQPAKETVINNTPVGKTKKMKEGVKDTVTKEDMAIVGKIIMSDWRTIFQEFGTSQQKHNVGFFDRSINETTDKVVSNLADGLLSKIK